jgi:hypothetical protein
MGKPSTTLPDRAIDTVMSERQAWRWWASVSISFTGS